MYNVLEGSLLRAMRSYDDTLNMDAHCRYISDLSRLVSTYKFEVRSSKQKGNFVKLLDTSSPYAVKHTRPSHVGHLNLLLKEALKKERIGYHAEFVQRWCRWGCTYVVEGVKVGYQDIDDPLVKVFTI